MDKKLTPRQKDILLRVIQGEEHQDIAVGYEVGKTAITNDLKRAARNMGARNTAHLVALWSQAQALTWCIGQISEERLKPVVAELRREQKGLL